MTREEHKKAIIENLNAMVDKLEDDNEYFDALYHLDMFCKEIEPCEDCISRAEAQKHIYTRLYESALNNVGYECNAEDVFMDIADNRLSTWISEIPSIQPKPKPKTGHWRAVYQGNEIINYRCTECEVGNTFGRNTYRMNYCPNCGAKMKNEV